MAVSSDGKGTEINQLWEMGFAAGAGEGDSARRGRAITEVT